ncbi:sugar ABC transporter ATP-binding protein [Rubinisphaera brasiliensis]|uniref:Monosaccharide ABC transporter ATP-binding protein, CUT2 family n=1 Tax=Rubinisphaera brasiliensis (strain ATCC 49424 / DSM 5305 / JCM 21570 / IAM 15109 / NBRC 103401 / IFAM 1448) TaxID=756272 RepID=F0SMP1_RUBBR|nr:sugar ABC transporter ATP-binding protein [Rubinisphaera brasiliensis]ADY58860.1 monosaccharide ABC transporter ATP-binding protein, CUT2 family [Rubinisphaera brasiliensis DSM 5305]
MIDTQPKPPAPLLEVRGLSKQFPGVKALQNVNLTLGRGEILAVVGENGAGKSTLMKILAGVQRPDSGEILLEGQPQSFGSVDDSLDAGISLIHQELNLSDNLDVAANIFLGREPHRWGLLDRKQICNRANAHLKQVGLSVSPRQLVRHLSVGQQQLVEIAKALSTDARILIMDEPTSALSQREADNLLQVVKELKAAGVSILYISHRLAEVEELADRVTVLRDGQNAGELDRAEITHEAMVSRMVGRDVSRFYQRTSHTPGETVLRMKEVVTTTWPQHAASFELRRGEIVGLAGLVGAGRSELLRAIFGVDSRIEGTVELQGKQLPSGDARAAIRGGCGFVPEDRKEQGLILEMSVRENASLASLKTHATGGVLLNRRYEQELSAESIRSLGIRTPHAEQIVGLLSGGNQQKVVLAKWLATNPAVLFLDEPTRGIDIGAKEEIYRLLDDLAGKGLAILFASSELEEIIGMSDRVLVMHEGELTGELPRSELSEQRIMQLATGQKKG